MQNSGNDIAFNVDLYQSQTLKLSLTVAEMHVFDVSKLASFDAASWQIVVVVRCAVAAVAAFVAAVVVEIISFAHFELAFET